MAWGLALAAGASLLGGLASKPPKAKKSEAEQAQAELMSAMRTGWEENGIPLQRKRIQETLGMQYDPATKTYSHDPSARRSVLNAEGGINYKASASGEAVAGVSQAYESQRGRFNPNAGPRGIGDIAQAQDEAAATRQTSEMDYSNALTHMGNAAGMAHGAQMESAGDIGELAGQQATQANFNAASRFARQTNNRGMAGELVGAGAAMYNRFKPQTPTQRLGNRQLHSGGR